MTSLAGQLLYSDSYLVYPPVEREEDYVFCEQVRAVHAVDIIKGKGLLTYTELNPESQLKQSLMAHA